jgi:hypothetical protein
VIGAIGAVVAACAYVTLSAVGVRRGQRALREAALVPALICVVLILHNLFPVTDEAVAIVKAAAALLLIGGARAGSGREVGR